MQCGECHNLFYVKMFVDSAQLATVPAACAVLRLAHSGLVVAEPAVAESVTIFLGQTAVRVDHPPLVQV